MFVSVGMCEQAVSAYIKVSKLKEAIDCCVELNQVSYGSFAGGSRTNLHTQSYL